MKSRSKYILTVIISFIMGIVVALLSMFIISKVDRSKIHLSSDFETYLKDDTVFCENAANVMPTYEELSDSKIQYYLYQRDDNAVATAFSSGSIFLTVEYSDEQFTSESKRLNELYKQTFNNHSSEFYLNGILYCCFQYEYEQALAYHICSDSNTISYFVFHSAPIQYMELEHAIKYALINEEN